jgi:hypothetical protein
MTLKNKFLFVLFGFAAINFNYVNSDLQPVVNTPLGRIGGYHMKTQDGKDISAFTAIPYALPPVGELRFKVGCEQSAKCEFTLSNKYTTELNDDATSVINTCFVLIL